MRGRRESKLFLLDISRPGIGNDSGAGFLADRLSAVTAAGIDHNNLVGKA